MNLVVFSGIEGKINLWVNFPLNDRITSLLR